jgi:integrase
MQTRLTDTIVKRLTAPASGNKITYDDSVAGFGCRVTHAGARAFILNYRTRGGRERRYTIGSFPDWKTAAARTEASELKKRIDIGEDPMAESEAEREAKTVADMILRFDEEHLPKTRPSTAAGYRSVIALHIEPELKHHKVADIGYSDIDALHRKITRRAPYQANRAIAVLSKMFSLAVRWRWRPDNPVKGVERNQEHKRQRYLSGEELARLTVALAAHDDRQAANIVRLLLLTGARRGEALQARWDQFDLGAGVWTKPGATTKQKTAHRVPLSGPARQLLSDLHAEAEAAAKKTRRDVPEFIFPSRSAMGHRITIKKDWAALCIAAKISGARLHDCRHTYASVLASAGLSLPIIGALLGHSNPQTTARYAHLLDDPLRAATERAGAIISGKPSAEIIAIKGAG